MIRILLLSLLLTAAVYAGDIEDIATNLEFAEQLPGSGVRKGNGVVLSGDMLWITESDGSLRILNITNGYEEHGEFIPIALTDRTIECRSSVSLHHDHNNGVFAVYAILDVPERDSHSIVSRVMAVSETGEHLWESVVSGIAVGTPQIDSSGKHIYLTHNDQHADGSYSIGKLTVIRHDLFGLASEINLENAGAFGTMEKPAPFTPLAVVKRNGKELVYWAEAWEGGQASFGVMYEYDGEHVRGLGRTLFSSLNPPIIRTNSMWIGGAGSSIHAWIAPHPFSSQPSWSIRLDDDKRAIEQTPIVTSDAERLYALTANHKLVCLNATTGVQLWANDGQEVATNAMKLSIDETALYTIGTDTGVVTAFDAATGRIAESTSCEELGLDEDCRLQVLGDFDLSDLPRLYFVDVDGNLVALRLDPIEYPLDPTASPSIAPSAPTGEPTNELTPAPTPEPATAEPTAIDTIAPTVTAAVTEEPTLGVSIRTRDPTQSPVVQLEPAESPLYTPAMPFFYFPAYTPAMSPAQFLVFEPTLADIEIDPAPSPALDNLAVDLDLFKVNQTPISVQSKSTIGNFGAFCIASIFMLAILSSGILFGRLWQLRRISFESLPLNDKYGYDQENDLVTMQTRLFGKPQVYPDIQ